MSSKMRNSEYVVRNDAYIEAEKASGMSREDFYRAAKSRAMSVQFPELARFGQGGQLIARQGGWERWTNGQDPIWSTYKGSVEWKGSTSGLLAEIVKAKVNC